MLVLMVGPHSFLDVSLNAPRLVKKLKATSNGSDLVNIPLCSTPCTFAALTGNLLQLSSFNIEARGKHTGSMAQMKSSMGKTWKSALCGKRQPGPSSDWSRRGRMRTCVVSDASYEAEMQLNPEKTGSFKLACPICNETEFIVRNVDGKPQGSLSCSRCKRQFDTTASTVDLTLTSGVPQKVYKQKRWGGTEIFRNPLVSLVYERGWRQGFAWAGFPGADREFEMAMEFFLPVYGSTLLDMSCGSGLFSRRFIKSEKFPQVIAADFSESMLAEARSFLEQDAGINKEKYLLLRADVGRLPFRTGSLKAIHAGAALHCWPDPYAALAEISRCLAPGGIFVASTFLGATAPIGQALGNDELVRPLRGLIGDSTVGFAGQTAYKWWEEDEIRDLCSAVGLVEFQRNRQSRFIMFSVRKPE